LNFNIVPRPGVTSPTKFEELTAVEAPEGQYAIIEFTGALPRAGLYRQWQVMTNDQAALTLMSSPDFNPAMQVLVADPVSLKPSADPTPVQPVEFVSYAPKHIVLQAKAAGDSVLLLNDRFGADWNVYVDGQLRKLLRCNFIMRGVEVPAGQHTIEFKFEPPIRSLYVSLAALVVGILLAAYLLVPVKKPSV
jgi:hypothetical protein